MSEDLAERIDRLFRTHLNPEGKEFSYRQVANAISRSETSRGRGETVSSTYIWALRTAAKTNPTMRQLQAIARFFQVSPSYFFDEELADYPEGEVRLLAASGNRTLQQVALASLGLSDESLKVVLGLLCHLRRLERLPAA